MAPKQRTTWINPVKKVLHSSSWAEHFRRKSRLYPKTIVDDDDDDDDDDSLYVDEEGMDEEVEK